MNDCMHVCVCMCVRPEATNKFCDFSIAAGLGCRVISTIKKTVRAGTKELKGINK